MMVWKLGFNAGILGRADVQHPVPSTSPDTAPGKHLCIDGRTGNLTQTTLSVGFLCLFHEFGRADFPGARVTDLYNSGFLRICLSFPFAYQLVVC